MVASLFARLCREKRNAMFDLEDLQTFVEVANAGGVSPAARRLGVSKSIVSRRLFRLEAELLSTDHQIPFKNIIGERVTVGMELAGGKTRYFNWGCRVVNAPLCAGHSSQ